MKPVIIFYERHDDYVPAESLKNALPLLKENYGIQTVAMEAPSGKSYIELYGEIKEQIKMFLNAQEGFKKNPQTDKLFMTKLKNLIRSQQETIHLLDIIKEQKVDYQSIDLPDEERTRLEEKGNIQISNKKRDEHMLEEIVKLHKKGGVAVLVGLNHLSLESSLRKKGIHVISFYIASQKAMRSEDAYTTIPDSDIQVRKHDPSFQHKYKHQIHVIDVYRDNTINVQEMIKATIEIESPSSDPAVVPHTIYSSYSQYTPHSLTGNALEDTENNAASFNSHSDRDDAQHTSGNALEDKENNAASFNSHSDRSENIYTMGVVLMNVQKVAFSIDYMLDRVLNIKESLPTIVSYPLDMMMSPLVGTAAYFSGLTMMTFILPGGSLPVKILLPIIGTGFYYARELAHPYINHNIPVESNPTINAIAHVGVDAVAYLPSAIVSPSHYICNVAYSIITQSDDQNAHSRLSNHLATAVLGIDTLFIGIGITRSSYSPSAKILFLTLSLPGLMQTHRMAEISIDKALKMEILGQDGALLAHADFFGAKESFKYYTYEYIINMQEEAGIIEEILTQEAENIKKPEDISTEELHALMPVVNTYFAGENSTVSDGDL